MGGGSKLGSPEKGVWNQSAGGSWKVWGWLLPVFQMTTSAGYHRSRWLSRTTLRETRSPRRLPCAWGLMEEGDRCVLVVTMKESSGSSNRK